MKRLRNDGFNIELMNNCLSGEEFVWFFNTVNFYKINNLTNCYIKQLVKKQTVKPVILSALLNSCFKSVNCGLRNYTQTSIMTLRVGYLLFTMYACLITLFAVVCLFFFRLVFVIYCCYCTVMLITSAIQEFRPKMLSC